MADIFGTVIVDENEDELEERGEVDEEKDEEEFLGFGVAFKEDVVAEGKADNEEVEGVGVEVQLETVAEEARPGTKVFADASGGDAEGEAAGDGSGRILSHLKRAVKISLTHLD